MDYPGKLKSTYIKVKEDSIERILNSRDYQFMVVFGNERRGYEIDCRREINPENKKMKSLCKSPSK